MLIELTAVRDWWIFHVQFIKKKIEIKQLINNELKCANFHLKILVICGNNV